MLDTACLLVLLLQVIAGGPTPKQDPEELKLAEKECKAMNQVFRHPGEALYLHLEAVYDYYYFCKGPKATRVDCTRDLVDKICSDLQKKKQ